MGKWDWKILLQDNGGGQTYWQWLMGAWGWTCSVAVLSLIVALTVGSIVGILRTAIAFVLLFVAWKMVAH